MKALTLTAALLLAGCSAPQPAPRTEGAFTWLTETNAQVTAMTPSTRFDVVVGAGGMWEIEQ